MTKQRTPVEQDAFQAWIYASNCLLYENDPGPAELNVGTATEPHFVPRSVAWQQGYAMNILVDCDGDHARLLAAARECEAEAARRAPDSPHRAREWARAVEREELHSRIRQQLQQERGLGLCGRPGARCRCCHRSVSPSRRPEPAVRLSTQRALHASCPVVSLGLPVRWSTESE